MSNTHARGKCYACCACCIGGPRGDGGVVAVLNLVSNGDWEGGEKPTNFSASGCESIRTRLRAVGWLQVRHLSLPSRDSVLRPRERADHLTVDARGKSTMEHIILRSLLPPRPWHLPSMPCFCNPAHCLLT